MNSAIGWYGPLIDLSQATSHVGNFVQLLVFVHRSIPVQYKLSKGGQVIRTDIQVGDDSRSCFSVSLWQKQIASMAFAGDIILLQNVKIIKYRDVVEARTVLCSSLLQLVHPFESLLSKGVNDLIGECRVGRTTEEKLRKVIEWAQKVGTTLQNAKLLDGRPTRQVSRNWKVPEEKKSCNCFSLSEVLRLSNPCKAVFYASVGEIFLPLTSGALCELEKEKMFISRRLSIVGDNSLAEDLICTGCQLCGSPLDLESGSKIEQNPVPLYCQKSSNQLHAVSLIYRPFVLYVWDEMEYIPLLVTNKAAEILFGNIKAERVNSCYKENNFTFTRSTKDPKTAGKGDVGSRSSSTEFNKKQVHNKNFHLIWLILLKMLVQQSKNSPLKFEVNVNTGLNRESGRFEMVSVSMPCFRTNHSTPKRPN